MASHPDLCFWPLVSLQFPVPEAPNLCMTLSVHWLQGVTTCILEGTQQTENCSNGCVVSLGCTYIYIYTTCDQTTQTLQTRQGSKQEYIELLVLVIV